VPKVRPWFNPSTSPDAAQATPPGLNLAGLLPLAEGVEQFTWVQTARDGVIVPRYNVDLAEMERAFGSAVNAFNAAYVVQGDGGPANVFASAREFARPEEAEEFVTNYQQVFAESDAQNNLRRVPDEAFQVCLTPTSSGLRAFRRPTRAQQDDCEGLSITQELALATAYGYLLAWNPVERVRLIGWVMVVWVATLVMEFAWFIPFAGAAETFDTAEPDSLEGWELGRDSVITIIEESAVISRYQSPPTGACFPEVASTGLPA
jgi:hypothetical protein